jgi:hypothetical protein
LRQCTPREPARWIDVPISAGSKIGQIGVPISARSEFGQIDVPILDQIGRCRISVSISDQNDLTLSGEQSPNSCRTVAEQSWNAAEQSPNFAEHRRTSPNIAEHLTDSRRTPPNISEHLTDSHQPLTPPFPSVRAASIGKSLLHNSELLTTGGDSPTECRRRSTHEVEVDVVVAQTRISYLLNVIVQMQV